VVTPDLSTWSDEALAELGRTAWATWERADEALDLGADPAVVVPCRDRWARVCEAVAAERVRRFEATVDAGTDDLVAGLVALLEAESGDA